MGLWKIENGVQLFHIGNREFCSHPIDLTEDTEFKFVIKHGYNALTWENGDNRKTGI